MIMDNVILLGIVDENLEYELVGGMFINEFYGIVINKG